MLRISRACGYTLAAVSLLACATLAEAQKYRGYNASVAVSAPTRLDMVFPLATQSLAEPPADWFKGYDSTTQHYELFVPRVDPGKTYPVVLSISASNSPVGWSQWKSICEQRQIIFASPFEAGNGVDMPQRIRIVLDVLDDLRRNYPIDPDRTYLSGFSGGARVASGLTFALPELFGGVIPICASEDLREESWLRHRAIERLSVGLVTGEKDFNRGEMATWRGPLFADVGVRTKVWVVLGMGHSYPDTKTLADVYAWMNDAAAERTKLAKRFSAMHLPANVTPTRNDAAQRLLREAQDRVKKPETLYTGLMQMVGVMQRWPDTPAGEQAKETLLKYEAQADKPWEEADLAEQRKFLAAEAKGLAAYALGPLPEQYAKIRSKIAAAALTRWQTIVASDPDSALAKDAPQIIEQLERLVDKNDAQPDAPPKLDSK